MSKVLKSSLFIAVLTLLTACGGDRDDNKMEIPPAPARVRALSTAQFNSESGGYSSPLVTRDGNVVFAAGSDVYFLNGQGQKVASFHAGDKVLTKPLELADGTIVVGSFDKMVYFLGPDAKKKAEFQTQAAVIASPALLSDGTVVVGSVDRHVYFLNPDGSERARLRTGDSILVTPAVQSDDTVVVASADRGLYFVRPDGTLKAKAEIPTIAISAPLVLPDDSIAYGSIDHHVYFVDKEGQPKFSVQTGGEVLSKPALWLGGLVIAGSDDGKIHFIDSSNGSVKTSIALAGGHITTPYVFPDGRFVVGAGKTQYFFKSCACLEASLILNQGASDQTQFEPAGLPDGRVAVVSSESIRSAIYFLRTETID